MRMGGVQGIRCEKLVKTKDKGDESEVWVT